ncbi:MAG TPA: FkbM family methyltransferase [Conexibacter sp.]|jgi:FkbM family methyltransferase
MTDDEIPGMQEPSTQAEPPPLSPFVARTGALLRRFPIVARSGLGPAYLRLQRRRRRAARRAAEGHGDFSRSRPAFNGIDRALEPYIGDVQRGFFVEAGANDGFTQSNTYHLERERGWSGLLVEPVPHLHREAALERPGSRVVHAALTEPAGEGREVTLEYGGLMTVVSGSRGSREADATYVAEAFALGLEAPMTVTAPARTLSALLDEMSAPEIDLMSLDLEGFEPTALRGLDLARHAPRYLLVEVREPDSRAAVESVLGERFRFERMLTHHDALYARTDQPTDR